MSQADINKLLPPIPEFPNTPGVTAEEGGATFPGEGDGLGVGDGGSSIDLGPVLDAIAEIKTKVDITEGTVRAILAAIPNSAKKARTNDAR